MYINILHRLLLLVLLLLTNTGFLVAQTANNNQSLLWSIKSAKTGKLSYLFGTIHLICPTDYLWTPKMEESFNKSEKICFEMDIDDPNVLMQAAMAMIDNSGKKIKDYFTDEQYKKLEKYFIDNIGMDLALIPTIKPIGLQSFLVTKFSGCTNPVAYEDSMKQKAITAHKEIWGLEQPQEQIEVLNSLPVDTVIKEIMDAINDTNTTNNGDEAYNQLVAAYKQQDLPLLFNLITTSTELGDKTSLFLDDRNKKWISRMADKMKQTTVFFAVGAGHLWGDNGVINLLRDNGYIVEPIK